MPSLDVFAEMLEMGGVAQPEALIAQGYGLNAPLKKDEETAQEGRELTSWPIAEAAKARRQRAHSLLKGMGVRTALNAEVLPPPRFLRNGSGKAVPKSRGAACVQPCLPCMPVRLARAFPSRRLPAWRACP